MNTTPKPAKNSIAPAWLLAGMAVMRFILTIIGIISIRKLMADHNLQVSKIVVIVNFFFVVVLTAEAFIYRKIRKKIYNPGWVLAHLLLVFIAMVIVPLIFVVLPPVMERLMDNRNIASFYKVINKTIFYFSWICFIGGNCFFVATVIKSFQFKQESPDDTGLVDI